MSTPSQPNIYKWPRGFNGAVEISWQPPSSNGGNLITNYIIESANIPFTNIVSSNTRKIRVPNLINGRNYIFSVKAVNSFGNGTPSFYNSVIPGFKPSNPTNFDFTNDVSNSIIRFSFNANANANIRYNTVSMIPIDDTGNILVNSSLRYFRSNYGSNIMDPVIFDRINTNYNYSTFVQSINSVDYSDRVFTNSVINPNLPSNGLKLWLDPYDLSTLTLSNNRIISWQDKSVNKANAMPIFDKDFLPSDVSGLRIWYDASDPSGNGILPANDTQIATIVDKSGNGYNALRGNGGSGAILKTNMLNSKPILYFNYSQWYTITYSNFPTSYSIFAIYKINSISPGYTGGYQRLISSYVDSKLFVGVNQQNLATFVGNTSWNDGNPNTPSFSMLDNYAILSLTNNSTTLAPFINGTAQDTKNGSTVLFNDLTLGVNPGAGQYLDGNVAEILIYNQVLSTSNRQLVEGYLASKWGLQSSLASNHPYKSGLSKIAFNNRSLIPTDLDNLQLWLDGNDPSGNAIIPANVSTITTWFDKSYNSRSATTRTGTITYNSSTKGLIFNGSSSMNSNLSASTNTECAFIILSMPNTSGDKTILGASNNGGRQFRINGDNFVTMRQFTSGVLTTPFTISLNTRFLAEFINNGTTLTHYGNSTNVGSASSQTYTSALTTIIGGVFANGNNTEFMNGTIHEVLIFSSISSSDREKIEGYLAWKWGLQSSLPSTHPFKNSAPTNPIRIAVAPSYDSSNALVRFQGNQYLFLPANVFPSANSNYSIFFYGDTSNLLVNTQYLFYSGNSSTSSELASYISSNRFNHLCGNLINISNLNISANVNNLYEFYNDNGNTLIYLNGSLANISFSSNRSSDFLSNNIIGTNRLFNANLIGSIGEIIMYDRLLNNTEISKIKSYLQRKKNNISLQNLGNLVLWLDSSDDNYLYDANIKKKVDYNNIIYNWLDRSSANNNAIYSNVSTLPTKKPIIQNNLDTLEFNQSYLTIPRAYYPLDAFIVVKLDNISNINGILGVGPNSNNYLSLSYNTQGVNAWAINGTANSIISSFTETTSNFLLMEWSISANNNYIRKNGANINSIKTGTFSLPTNSNIIIGNNNGFDFSRRFTGYIGELIIFNKQLDDGDRYPIEGYLAWKWGLQSFLANSHPYKNSAPYLFYKYIDIPYVHFFPNSVSGLQLWLDANDATTFNLLDNNISQWRDKSGNSNHFNASSGFATRIVESGRNVVNFTSGPLLTSVSSISLTTSTRILCVCRNTKTSAPFSMLLCAIDWGDDRSVRYVGNELIGSYTEIATAVNELLGNSINVDGKRDNSVNTTVYHMWDGSCPINVSSRLQISSTFYGDRYFEGQICEILVYSSLNNEDYKKLQGYLAWKWGIQSRLSSSHPYKNTNPNNITSSFVPTDLYNTALWLDASDSSTITISGNNVIQWNDKSGSGLHVFKNTSSPGPTYITNILNSKPVVNFVVGQFLETLSLNPSSTFTTDGTDTTIFLITQLNGDGVNNLASFGLNTTYNNYILRTPWSNSNRILDIGYRLDFNYNLNNQIVLFSFGRNGTNMFLYNNGSLIGSLSNAPLSSNVTTLSQKLLIGAGDINYYDGYLAEFLIFKTALSSDERQKVEGYLAHKWGLNSNLPSNHPFKLSTPITISKSFLPSDISGLRLWIDAQDSSTVVLSGSTIIQLFDKSNNRYVFSGASGFTYNVTKFNTIYPSFYNNTQNSNFTLGSNNSIILNQPFTAFYVGIMTTAATNWSFIHDSTTSNNRIVFYNSASIFHAGNNMSGQTNILYQNYLISGYFNSNNSSAYNNGINYNTGDVGTNNGTSLLLGNRYTLDDAYYGHLCEIIFYDGILSTNQRQKVEGYLAWKWGLQNNLATSHPYYNINIGSSVTYNIITENLILYLDPGNKSCYNGLSNTLFDLSPEKNNCTLINSPTFSANDHGKFTFNGSTQYIATNISNINRSFTFSIWVKFNSISGPQTFMCEDTNIPIQTARFYFQKPDSGTFANYINFKLIINDSNFVDVYGSAPLVINTWYNFSVSVSLNTIKMYTNGILNNTVNNNLSLIPFRQNSNMVINAGYFQDILVNYFNGESGSYLIYNRDLTDDEVLQNYNAMKMKYT